jgi:hypothetical protein
MVPQASVELELMENRYRDSTQLLSSWLTVNQPPMAHEVSAYKQSAYHLSHFGHHNE